MKRIKVAVFSLFGLFYLILAFNLYIGYKNSVEVLRGVAHRNIVSLANILKILMAHSPFTDPTPLLQKLVVEGNFDYIAIVRGDSIIYWASYYEGFLPIDPSELVDERILKTPLHRIMEFKKELGNKLYLVGGYSLSSLDLAEKRLRIELLVLFIATLISGVLVFIVIDRIYARVIKVEKELEKERLKRKRYEELSRLSSGISHEIKNPLNSISIATQLLEREVESSYIETIKGELRRIERIIDDFRNLSRPINPKVEKFKLVNLLDRVIASLKHEFKDKNIRVEREGYGGDVEADPLLLEQIIYNILKNAFEAMDEGVISIKSSLKDGFLTIVVEDTGCGMDEETLKLVGEPFFTTKSRGLGIGLFIVKKIVESLNGKLLLESEKGKGTRVTVKSKVAQS